MSGLKDPLGGFTIALVTLIVVSIILKKYGEENLMGTEVSFD